MYNTRFVREDYEKASHMNDLYYHNIARRWPTIPLYDPNGNYSEPSEILQLQQGGRSKFQKDFLISSYNCISANQKLEYNRKCQLSYYKSK